MHEKKQEKHWRVYTKGDLYFSDTTQNRIKKVSYLGTTITNIIGQGKL